MYYERSRHYNPILSLKATAGARGEYYVLCNMGYRNGRSHRKFVVRKNARVVTPHHRANGPTWISLRAKRVIARSLEIPASSVIVRKDLMKNPSQVFMNQLEFATVAGNS